MMLRWFDGDRNELLSEIPHQGEYQLWRSRLTTSELTQIFEHIDGLIETGSLHTSSWLPGSVWTGTPLDLIYEKAARCSEEQAGWCFGLMLRERIIEQPEQWYCKKDPEVAEGTIYWRA